MSRDQVDQVVQSPSNLTFNIYCSGTTRTSISDLFQYLTTPTMEKTKTSIASNLNLSSFALKPLFLFLSLQVLVKILPHFFYKPCLDIEGSQ